MEELEGRLLLYATTGDHFTYGSRITWGYEADGTNLGGVSSNLVSTFTQDMGAGSWQNAISDAFAQWENVAGINLTQVNDDGNPTGSGSYQQGDPNMADIRIGGYAMSSNVLAFALLPPPNNGGSDSGDIFFNTSLAWHVGSGYDLETVALHEIGHALGMGHSADTNAAMYAYYTGTKQSPDPDDVAGIQSVWGPRLEDGLTLGNSNFTSAHAADLTPFINGANDQLTLPGRDVASSSEVYWFKITTPANASSTLSMQVQSTNLSELSPQVQIYNSALQGLAQVSGTPTSYGATETATINNATPNTVYYFRVSGSNAGDTGSGSYALSVNMGTAPIVPSAPPNTMVLAQADQGGGGINEKIGGANNKSNGPVDVPDKIMIGQLTAQGDFLLVPTKAQEKEGHHVRIKVTHPARTGSLRHSRTSLPKSKIVPQ